MNKFNGGLTMEKYSKYRGVSSESVGFDIMKYKDRISPHPDKSDERLGSSGGTLSLSIMDACNVGAELIAIAKYDSGATGTRFLKKYDNDPRNNYWVFETNCTNLANPNFCISYKGYAYANAGATLYKRTSSTTVSSIGTMTISSASYGSLPIKAVVHSQDNVLYMAYGDRIQKYDGTTFTAGVLTMPSDIYAIEEYGQYLAIYCYRDDGTAMCYFWGRDTSLTTLQDAIPIGHGLPKIAKVIDGILFAVCEVGRTIYIRALVGGTFKQISTFDFPSPSSQSLNYFSYKKDNKIYFALNNGISFVFGQNADGEYVVSADRNYIATGETSSAVYGMFALTYNVGSGAGSIFHYMSVDVVSGTVGTCRMIYPDDGAVENSLTFYGNSRWTTSYNPEMPVEDLARQKTLKFIRAKLYLKTPSATGTFTLSYETDQSGTFTTIDAKSIASTDPNVYILEANAESSSIPFATAKDFRFRLTTASGKKVDLHQLEYEYEVNNA